MKLRFYFLSVLVAVGTVLQAQQTIPNFDWISGVYHIEDTQGDSVMVTPAQPNNLHNLETQLFQMPAKGSGLMGVRFRLRGADGGKATYTEISGGPWVANGGEGGTLGYTFWLDQSNPLFNTSNSYGKYFFVTYGKNGQSATNHYGPCAGGGGGATGMAWILPGLDYDNYTYNYHTYTVFGIAAGGGGGEIVNANVSGAGNGGGITSIGREAILNYSACPPYSVEAVAGSAGMDYDRSGMRDNLGNQLDDCSWAAYSGSGLILQGTSTGNILTGILMGQWGGYPCSWPNGPPQSSNYGEAGFNIFGCGGQELLGAGNAGGSGYCGGGAGSAPMNGWVASGGGGGHYSISQGIAGYASVGTATHTVVPSYGGENYIGLDALTNTYVINGGNTSNPASGSFQYQTIRDTVPPVIHLKNVSVYLDGYGGYNLTRTDIDNGSTDNDSIQDFIIYNSGLTCSQIGQNTITVRLIDFAGNQTLGACYVTVIDTLHPSIPYSLTHPLYQLGTVQVGDITVDNYVTGIPVDVSGGPVTIDQNYFQATTGGAIGGCNPDYPYTLNWPPTVFGCSQIGTYQNVPLTVTFATGRSTSAIISFYVYSSITNLNVYVDASATGANNGTTWTDAYTSLQDALDYGCTQGRTIYVAQGTYYPDHGFDVALNNKSMSFTLRNGDQIYGGFPSGGDIFDNRNPSQYPVVLSGNIGSGSSTADNTYQVLTIPAGASGTHIEGVTISNSYNNLAMSPNGGGVFITSNQPNNLPVADFVNCTFSNNYSTYGGGVGFVATGYAGTVSFENCRFLNNSSFYSGAGVNINGGGETRTSTNFTNCVFQHNTANTGAGVDVNSSKVVIANCSFGGNYASNDGGALQVEGANQQVYVYNTIMYGDTSFSNTEIYQSPAQVNIAYSDIQGSGGSSAWNSIVGINGGHNIDANPLYINGSNLQVLPTSPVRNAGSIAYNSTELDLNGAARVTQDTIDMGAYETSPIVYVAWDAANGGDGTSWATAFNQLQDGINASYLPGYFKEIWIKTGTYYPAVNYNSGVAHGRQNTFVVSRSQKLFGGFAGNETSIYQRNIQLHPTILSGDLGTHGDSTDNAFHVITLNQVISPRFDGLIIQDGNADSTDASYQYGGGVYCVGTIATPYPTPTFVNCVFRHNNSANGGGAVTCLASPSFQYNMNFVQCLFYDNSTAGYGGALFINNTGGLGNNIICNLYNCTASGNRAAMDGGFAGSRCTVLTTDTATLNLYNTVLYGDVGTTGEYINARGVGLLHAYNSFTGFPNPHFVNAANPAGADGKIMTADDGLKLQSTGSNYVNGGNNAYLLNGSVSDSIYDVTGAPRIQQQTVDIGAYENKGCLGFTTLYVDNHAAVSGLGNSWSSPFKYLQQALSVSNICPTVDTILVAQGIYSPNEFLIGTTNRDTSFYISKPVTILGGYGAFGGPRNVVMHPSILEGNVNSPAYADDLYHIMVVNCAGATDTTVVDGFAFRNGTATGSGNYTIGGTSFSRGSGAAIIEASSKLVVSHCNFSNNQANLGGGAIDQIGGFVSCYKNTFNANSANYGGAIRTENSAGSVLLANSNVFYKNTSTLGGGGALSLAMGVTPAPYSQLVNNVFAKNKTNNYGGAAVIFGGNSDVYNNTFYADSALGNGGAILVLQGATANVNMYNNIFYKNRSNSGTHDYYLIPGAGSITQGNNSFSTTDPQFKDEVILTGSDNIWATSDDGLELKNTSSLINLGTSAVVNYNTDITGANRTQLGGVDLGAYEANTMVTRWYVSQGQDSVTGDGSSWANAFPQFSQGLNAAKPGDTIWVAKGTYLPASGTPFRMKSNVQIYGGFNATESLLAQRVLASGNNSILQGNGSNVFVNDSVNSAAILDGFIIQNGTGGAGGGMVNNHSSPQVRSCVFTNNSASGVGGAVSCSNSSPVFTNVIFYSNSVTGVTSSGGALYCANNSYPIMRNCDFVNNTSTFNGGAIYSLSNAHPAVANSAFTGNTAANLYDDNFFAGGQNVSHCLMQAGNADSGNIISNTAGMLSTGTAAGPDGLWFTADDGLQLTYQSNLINKGINDSVVLATDITGGARIQNIKVDIGAYESIAYNYCDSASYNSTHLLYVDGSKGASGNGYSWQTAFLTLGEALDIANNCTSFDTILVAAGTYYPTGYQGESNRNVSFSFLRSGYQVLGGYPNGGGTRNPGNNNTILSGDINVAGDNTDNSYHVLVFKNADNTTGIDGFIVKAGSANSPNGDANGNGGGAWINGSGTGGYCRPRIANCVFTDNYAYYGAAVINDATLGGNSSPAFINCVFAKNTCDLGFGGAMYNVASYSGVSMPVITNCTFTQNTSTGYGGGIYDDCSLSGTVTTTLKNTILWGNTSNQDLADQQFTGNGCTSTASYCIVQGGLSGSLSDGGHNLYVNPLFSDSATLTGIGGNWMTSADGLKIYNSSPAINAGNSLGAPATDITATLHVGLPDIGAYENSCGGTVFVTRNVTACDSALAPSYRYWRTTGGTFNDTTLTSAGCDTVFTVNLTLNHSTFDSITVGACGSYASPGGNYVWDSTGVYTDVLQTVTGCDSVIKVNLTVYHATTSVISVARCGSYTSPSGKVWITTGIYNDTIPNSHGCDSVITIDLTIHSASASVVNAGICSGQSYLFNGVTLTASGTYLDTLQNVNGCDSIITLHLVVSNVLTGSFNQAICAGSSYLFNGQQLTQAGTYLDTLQAGGGCDSVVTLHLSINPILSGSFNAAICTGSSYSFNGQLLTQSGTYLDTLQGSTGCDSIVTLHLTVSNVLTSSFSQAICSGDSYLFNGQQLTQAGSYTDTLQSSGGCDSIVTLALTVNTLPGNTITVNGNTTFCNGDSVELTAPAGNSYLWSTTAIVQSIFAKTTGSYIVTVTNSNNCSAVALPVSVIANPLPAVPVITRINDTLTSTSAQTYKWYLNNNLLNGATGQLLFINQNGDYFVEVSDSNGCSNRSAVFNVLNVSIGTVTAGDGVVLYPNPNTGLFTIAFSNNEQKEIEITNTFGEVIGRVMSTEKKVSINLGNVASGIYFAHIKQNSQTQTIRFSLAK